MSGALTVETRDLERLTADERVQWAAWQAADPDLASPYFRVEFAEIAAQVSPDSAVAVFRRGDEVVGYFPFQKRGGAVLPIAAPMNDYHGVIGPKAERPSLAEVAHLLGGARFSVSAPDMAPPCSNGTASSIPPACSRSSRFRHRLEVAAATSALRLSQPETAARAEVLFGRQNGPPEIRRAALLRLLFGSGDPDRSITRRSWPRRRRRRCGRLHGWRSAASLPSRSA